MAWDWIAIAGFAVLAAYCALKGGGICSPRQTGETRHSSDSPIKP